MHAQSHHQTTAQGQQMPLSVVARAQAKFDQALALHKHGQFAQARELYLQLLKAQPRHSDALHLMGVLAYQTQNPTLAVELIDQSLKSNTGLLPIVTSTR